MAELRVELPSVVTLLAAAEVCDAIEAAAGGSCLRVAPGELFVLGAADVGAIAGASEAALAEDVSDAWVSLVLTGTDARAAFARLSELDLPPAGWVQGEVARAAAKVLVEAERITIVVPAMLAAHVEARVRADAAEVIDP